MKVAELIERLEEMPQHLEVVIPDPDPHRARATHEPCAVAEVRAARGHGGVGGWDLDGAHGRALVWALGRRAGHGRGPGYGVGCGRRCGIGKARPAAKVLEKLALAKKSGSSGYTTAPECAA